MTLVRNDKMELAEALDKVTQEAMAEQQQMEQQAAATTPEQAAAPQTVAAMAGPQSQIAGPNQSQQNLMSLLSTLRRPMTATGGV